MLMCHVCSVCSCVFIMLLFCVCSLWLGKTVTYSVPTACAPRSNRHVSVDTQAILYVCSVLSCVFCMLVCVLYEYSVCSCVFCMSILYARVCSVCLCVFCMLVCVLYFCMLVCVLYARVCLVCSVCSCVFCMFSVCSCVFRMLMCVRIVVHNAAVLCVCSLWLGKTVIYSVPIVCAPRSNRHVSVDTQAILYVFCILMCVLYARVCSVCSYVSILYARVCSVC
jgi:hypothetical protein